MVPGDAENNFQSGPEYCADPESDRKLKIIRKNGRRIKAILYFISKVFRLLLDYKRGRELFTL
jgi:hypothetical protein